MKRLLLPIVTLLSLSSDAQLVVDGATIVIGEGAVVTVQGNLTTNVAIQASGSGVNQGKIVMKGTANQQINTGGNLIPRLEIDNAAHVTLTGDVRVGNMLEFTNGKIIVGNNNFILNDGIVINGAGTGKFLETNGTGQVRSMLTTNVANRVVPVGSGSNYSPVSFTTTSATYGADAYVGVVATGAAIPTPNRHPRTESYLTTSWKINKSNVTGGTLAVTGTYADAQITGTEADLVGMHWNGSQWSLGTGQNAASNTVSANVPGTSGEVYGMNKFILANAKVFLHGPFNSNTGLMNDNLRANNLVPLSDPYRNAPYNYPHAANNNATAETIDASVVAVQGNVENNIVDWVVVELMNNNTPATVIQSRSVLLRRNGTLVDVDGVSPVYFKNVDAGNYNLSVRHRNHLGAMTPAVQALGLASPAAYDFTVAQNAAYTNPALTSFGPMRELPRVANTSVFGLYSGDANFNKVARITGSATVNDYSQMLNSLTATLGYHQRDFNMNGTVAATGSAAVNDYSRLLNSLNGILIVNQHEK